MEHIIKELVKSGFSMHDINEARKTMTPEEFSTPAFVEVSQISEGGVLSTATTSICENNVGGTIELASEVGTIIQWQESIDDGASWSSITNTNNSIRCT